MDISYIAGFFDGEGNCQSMTSKYNHIYFKFRISNNSKESLEQVKNYLGYGRIGINNKKLKKPTHHINWVLEIARYHDVVDFAKRILPHLIIKKAKVEKALEYLINNPPSYDVSHGFRKEAMAKATIIIE